MWSWWSAPEGIAEREVDGALSARHRNQRAHVGIERDGRCLDRFVNAARFDAADRRAYF
jgi:hypothetical protein